MKKYMVIAANVLLPGLGTLLAGRATQGSLQLLFAALGVLLWSTVSLRLVALLIYAFAWIWALISALRFKREADLTELHPVSIVERQSREQRR